MYFVILSITKSYFCIMISLNFLSLKSIFSRLFNYGNASGGFCHCLVLLTLTFTNNFINFFYVFFFFFFFFFLHIRALLKRKGLPGKKFVNSRSLVYLKDSNFCEFSGLEKFFLVHGKTLNRDIFKKSH